MNGFIICLYIIARYGHMMKPHSLSVNWMLECQKDLCLVVVLNTVQSWWRATVIVLQYQGIKFCINDCFVYTLFSQCLLFINDYLFPKNVLSIGFRGFRTKSRKFVPARCLDLSKPQKLIPAEFFFKKSDF